MFEPQMFMAALLLVYLNLNVCYQFSRFILGSFVSQTVPQFPQPLEAPGVGCYGSCTWYLSVRRPRRPFKRTFCASLVLTI